MGKIMGKIGMGKMGKIGKNKNIGYRGEKLYKGGKIKELKIRNWEKDKDWIKLGKEIKLRIKRREEIKFKGRLNYPKCIESFLH